MDETEEIAFETAKVDLQIKYSKNCVVPLVDRLNFLLDPPFKQLHADFNDLDMSIP
ncbi:MAG: hypothetical protein AAF985_10910 [Bacteroidota bacterium]